MKKILWILVAVALVGCLIYANQPKTQKENRKETIKIAVNLPLTGTVSLYGTSFKNGLLMSYQDNKDNLKSSVKFDWGDNQFSTSQTITVMQKQLFDNPNIYISGLKPQTNTLEKRIAEIGIPHFVWIPDRKINLNGIENEYRVWVNLQKEADLFIEYISKLNLNRIVVFYTETPTSHEIFKDYIPQQLKLKNKDIDILLLEFPITNLSDYRTLILKASKFKPDAVIINGFIDQMSLIIQSLNSEKILPNNRILASFDILDVIDTFDTQVSEGLIVVAPQFIVKPTQKEENWSQRYQQLYDSKPNYHSAYAYDMGLVIWNAINNTDTNTNLNKAIRAVNIDGITGDISFDNDGDIRTKMFLSTIKDKKIIPLESETK